MDRKDKTDVRKRYFLRVASHIFAANVIEDKISNIEALDKFCDGLAVILVFTKDEEVVYA